MPRTKRIAEAEPEAAPATKKPVRPLLVGVLDALKQAITLPESCREMLAAAAPGCLGTPPAERHETQAFFVRLIGEAIDSVRADLEEHLASVKEATAKLGETRVQLVEQVDAAKATLQTREAEVAKGEEAMNAAGSELETARSALAESKRLQTAGDARLVEAGKDKEKFEEALAKFKRLLHAEEYSEMEAAELTKFLVPTAKRLGLDDSLLIALPKASGHHPISRGPFDCMVLEQIQKSLVDEVTKLSSELNAGAPASQERADAVAAAQSKSDTVQKEREAVVEALVAAQEQAQIAKSALKSAEATLATFDSENSEAQRAQVEEKAAGALQNFQGYNVECFTMLRDQAADAAAEEAAG